MSTLRIPRRTVTYYDMVRWVAEHDEPENLDLISLSTMVSIGMVADLFDRADMTVARAVRRYRINSKAPAIRVGRRDRKKADTCCRECDELYNDHPCGGRCFCHEGGAP